MIPIFNELKYAEDLLELGFVKFMSTKDLIILAKYYKYLNLKPKEIQNKLIEFCEKYNSGFDIFMYREKINRVMRKSKKFDLLLPVDISITKQEINKIKEIDNYKYEKILFVFLCCAKHYKQSYLRQNKDKIDNKEHRLFLTFSTILKLSKVYMNKKDQKELLNFFYRKNYIRAFTPNYKNCRSAFELLFVDDVSTDTEVLVTDMNKIISFYPSYCKICGKVKISSRYKMCKECSKEVRMEKERNRARGN